MSSNHRPQPSHNKSRPRPYKAARQSTAALPAPLGLPDVAAFFSQPNPPLLLALDIEAWEHDQSLVTEIGWSTLDPSAAVWSASIVSTHIIIAERTHMVNKRFVKGCPENFLFGSSQVLPLSVARDAVKAALTPEGGREVIFVAHGLRGDVAYLAKMGVQLDRLRCVDTQTMAGSKKKPVGLKRLLDALGVEYAFLHNAGNDAAFTMRALGRMVEEFNARGMAWKDKLGLAGPLAKAPAQAQEAVVEGHAATVIAGAHDDGIDADADVEADDVNDVDTKRARAATLNTPKKEKKARRTADATK